MQEAIENAITKTAENAATSQNSLEAMQYSQAVANLTSSYWQHKVNSRPDQDKTPTRKQGTGA